MIEREKLNDLQNELAIHQREKAFTELHLLCFPSLVRFAYAFVKNKEIAEEVVSDVMIKVWEQRRSLNQISDLKSYLYVSAKNTAINYLKKRHAESVIDIDELKVWLKADDQTPEEIFISSEHFRKIHQAINELPPRCKMIYKLIKEDGFKYQEAAAILNLSIKTIEAQMAIAVKKLYEALITNKF